MTSTRPQVIEGIYQKGVIKLLDKVGLRENERVRM
ncbi:antitoxin family protein [Dehalococcoidia bacterium]|nr:antitoxin family protein [Dehalococcoidia bacterium]